MNMARMGYSEATALSDPQTKIVIPGLSENAAVTTCGWVRDFFNAGIVVKRATIPGIIAS
jgi:hypothetical protein